MFQLHGLTIDDRCGDDPRPIGGADLRWIHRIGAPKTQHVETAIFAEQRSDGAWTHYYFGDGEAARVHFAISPDGRLVESVAGPDVSAETLLDLFSETIMRSVFRHRGLVSFHTAVLSRAGKAIALMGARTAGKSTLSAGLVANGWRLVADDLARFGVQDGRWMAFRGQTRTKLNADVAAALDLPANRLSRRWTQVTAQPIPDTINKLIYAADPHQGDAVPLSAIYILADRSHELIAPQVTAISPAECVTNLLHNVTRDTAYPDAEPPPQAAVMALEMLGVVKFFRLTMPDDLSGLRQAAATFSMMAA